MRLSGQAIIVAFFSFVISFSGILSSIILSRQLLVKDYGTYKQVWLIFNTLAPIIILGTQTSVPFFVRKWHESREKTVLFLATIFVGSGSILSGILLYFNAHHIGHYFNNDDLTSLLKIFALYPFLTLSISFKDAYFISKQRPYLASLSTLISTILLLSASIIPTLFEKNLNETFHWIVVSAIVQFIFYAILFIVYKFHQPFIPNKSEISEFSKLSLTVGIGYLVQIFAILIDKYVISYYYSPVEFALYSNGSLQIPFVAIVTGSIMTVLFPKMVELKKNNKIPELLNYWNEAAFKSSLFIYPIFIFSFIMGREIMVVFFSDKYVGSTPIFQIYLILFLFRNIHYSSILLVFQDLKFYLVTSFLYLIFNFIGNLVLLKYLGLNGPAYATVIVTLILIIMILMRNAKLLGISLFQTLPYQNLFKIFMTALACGIIIYPIHQQFNSRISGLYLIMITLPIYLFFYLGTLLKLKFITLNDLNVIKYIR